MLINKSILGLALLLAFTAHAQEFKCPSNQGKNPLINADVFDGPPNEKAQLEPDVSRGKMTYTYASWDVGYLFDLGRTPFLVCKFAGLADAQAVTIKIDRKVQKCVFQAHRDGLPAEAVCK